MLKITVCRLYDGKIHLVRFCRVNETEGETMLASATLQPSTTVVVLTKGRAA